MLLRQRIDTMNDDTRDLSLRLQYYRVIIDPPRRARGILEHIQRLTKNGLYQRERRSSVPRFQLIKQLRTDGRDGLLQQRPDARVDIEMLLQCTQLRSECRQCFDRHT